MAQTLDLLHVMCTRLHPGHLSVRGGGRSRRKDDVVKIRFEPFNAMIIINIIIAIVVAIIIIINIIIIFP